MGRSDVISPQTAPACIHPQRGKVTKHAVEASNNKPWNVLNKDVAGSYLPNKTGELCP